MDPKIPTYSPVCMIYSQLSLAELRDILHQYSGREAETKYGPLRIIRAKDEKGEWRDTNRTITLVKEDLYNTLVQEGFHKPIRSPGRPDVDFRIVPYEIRPNNLPGEGLKKDLFIRIPPTLTLTTKDIETILNGKMSTLVEFGLLKSTDYAIRIPLRNKDRATDAIKGSCFLTFTDEVSHQTAALIKAVIDDTYWGESPETFHCFWAREQKKTKKQSQV